MGNPIIKIKDKFFIWSTIVDSPVSEGLTLDELKHIIKLQHGKLGLRELDQRLKRVEMHGTSMYNETLFSTIFGNKAGEKEKELTADEIYERYCE